MEAKDKQWNNIVNIIYQQPLHDMQWNPILFAHSQCKTDSTLKLLGVFTSDNKNLGKYIYGSSAKLHRFQSRQRKTELKTFKNASGNQSVRSNWVQHCYFPGGAATRIHIL